VINDQSTVQDARAFLKTQDDSYCPCCTQRVKTYRRAIPQADLPALGSLVKLTKDAIHVFKRAHPTAKPPVFWFHISQLQGKSGGGDFAKFRWWDFIVAKPNEDDPTKRDSGFWALKRTGAKFMRNQLSVPRRMFDRLGVCLGPVDYNDTVDLVEANEICHFDFQKLMRGDS